MKIYDLAGVAVSLTLSLAACSSDDSSSPSTGSAGRATSGTGGSTSAAGGTTSGSGGGASGASGGSGGNSASGSTGTGGTAGSDSGGGGALAGERRGERKWRSGRRGRRRVDEIDSGAGDATASEGGTVSDAGSDVTMSSDASRTSDGGGLMLTSTALAEGMTFPAANTCAGANTSPPLFVERRPGRRQELRVGAHRYQQQLEPLGRVGLAGHGDVAPGSFDARHAAYRGAQSSIGTNGAYSGPCPNGTVHRYIFEIYPLDVAKLPNVTATTSRPNLVTAIKAHQLVPPASLSGTSNAARP